MSRIEGSATEPLVEAGVLGEFLPVGYLQRYSGDGKLISST